MQGRPPDAIVRDECPPDDLLLVVRAGRNSLSDLNLDRAASDSWTKWGFFGVSVFGAPDDDLVGLSRHEPAIQRRPEVRIARCGRLRAAGFEIYPTFSNPRHYSVVLPDAGPDRFVALRDCFSDALTNPGHVPDR